MNLHPIFVHFPIAFLFVWSVISLVPVRRWLPRVAWDHIQIVLLVVGVLGAFGGLVTGDQAESLVGGSSLVETHSLFAGMTTIIYGVLLLGALASSRLDSARAWVARSARFIHALVGNPILKTALIVVSFVTLVITGVLGGVIAYGPNADPIAKVVLRMLGL